MRRFCSLFCILLVLGAGFAFPATAEECESLYPACREGLWGYINSNNEWVIEPVYDSESDLKGIYCGDFFYNDSEDEYTNGFGETLSYDPAFALLNPAYWGINAIGDEEVTRCFPKNLGSNYIVALASDKRMLSIRLFDKDANPLTETSYTAVMFAEDGKHAIVRWKGMAKDTGALIDENGKVLRENLPLGKLSEDGLVIEVPQDLSNPGYYLAKDGSPLTAREAAALHAAHIPEGLWSFCVSYRNYVYVDREGNVVEALGTYADASPFYHGFAYVEVDEPQGTFLIDTNGEIVVKAELLTIDTADFSSKLDFEFHDGLLRYRVPTQSDSSQWHLEGKYTYNFLKTDGSLLFPENQLQSAESFFCGRSLISVLLPDFSLVYAHIDLAGKVVWAEDTVDPAELQRLLDGGFCPSVTDITPQIAKDILLGDWVCTGGGEHLSNESFELDGNWDVYIADGDVSWAGTMLLLIPPQDDYPYKEEYYLTIHHRDSFDILDLYDIYYDGSGYARKGSPFDPGW